MIRNTTTFDNLIWPMRQMKLKYNVCKYWSENTLNTHYEFQKIKYNIAAQSTLTEMVY